MKKSIIPVAICLIVLCTIVNAQFTSDYRTAGITAGLKKLRDTTAVLRSDIGNIQDSLLNAYFGLRENYLDIADLDSVGLAHDSILADQSDSLANAYLDIADLDSVGLAHDSILADWSGGMAVTPANYPEWQSGLERSQNTMFNSTVGGRWRIFASGIGPGIIREIRLETRRFNCAECDNALDSLWITIRSGVDTLDPALVRGVYTGVDSFRASDFLWVPATPPADARYQTRYVTYKDTTAAGTRYLSTLARTFIYVPDTFSIWLKSGLDTSVGCAGSVVFETGKVPALGGMRYFHVDDVAIDTMPNASQAHWMGRLWECSGLGAGYIGAAHWTGIMEAGHQEFGRYLFADHDMPYTTISSASFASEGTHLLGKLKLAGLSDFSFDYPWPFMSRYRYDTRMYLTDGSDRDSAEIVLVSTYLGYPDKIWKPEDSLWVTGRASHAAGDTMLGLDEADRIDITQNHAVVDVSSTYARFSQDYFSGNAKLAGNVAGTVPHSWLVFYDLPFDSTGYVYGAMNGVKDAGVGPTRSVVYSWTEKNPITATLRLTTAAKIKDTYLREEKTTWNYGAADALRIGMTGGTSGRTALIWPDLSEIPAGATIIAATCSLYCNASDGTVDAVAEQISKDWVVGTATVYQFGSSSWNNRGSGLGVGETNIAQADSQWAVAGAQTELVFPDDTVAISATGWYVFEVENIMQAILDGTAYGIGISDPTATGGPAITSMEGTTSEMPRFWIQYQCAP